MTLAEMNGDGHCEVDANRAAVEGGRLVPPGRDGVDDSRVECGKGWSDLRCPKEANIVDCAGAVDDRLENDQGTGEAMTGGVGILRLDARDLDRFCDVATDAFY